MLKKIKILPFIICIIPTFIRHFSQFDTNLNVVGKKFEKKLKNLQNLNKIYNIFNNFSLWQILYWHDNSPAGEVTNLNSHPVDFSMNTKTVYATINNNGEINDRTWLNELNQTSHSDSSYNSGSYMYGDNGYDCLTRTPPWNKVLSNYINLYIPYSNYNWTNLIPNISLDIKNIWKPFEKISELNCKKVFQNGEQTDYVYNENQSINFIKGINKDLNNKDYNVYAIPYTYIKESQFIYVVYNFVSRFVYTLQTNANPNKTNYIKDHDNLINLSNPFVNIFNPSQLITIDHVDYNNHRIVLGINHELIDLINEYKLLQEKVKTVDFVSNALRDKLIKYCALGKFDLTTFNEFLALASSGYTDVDEFISNHITSFNEKLKTYKINDISQFINIYDQLSNILKLRVYYEIYDQNTDEFKKEFVDVDLNDLIYKKKAININQYENKYPFKIDSVEVLAYNDANICLLTSQNQFELQWSTKRVIKENNYIYIDVPQIGNVSFNDIDQKYYELYPSMVDQQEVINKFINLYDDNSYQLDPNVIDQSDIMINPNDLLGKINIKIKTINGFIEKDFNNFKVFDINQFNNVDAVKFQYGLITDDINKSVINEILLANNFDREILDNIDYDIVNKDLTKGTVDIKIKKVNKQQYQSLLNKQIKINNLSPVCLKQNNNKSILTSYKPSEITNEIFKQYLINISDGFKNLYGNTLKIQLNPHDETDELVAELTYGKNKSEFIYKFNDKNKIINYICFGLLGISICGLIICISLYARNKKLNKFAE